MKFYPRARINIISLLLIALFSRLSYWQWTRHLEKKAVIETLQQRLKEPVTALAVILASPPVDWSAQIHRRVRISGEYDFSHEMFLRNRRLDEQPGGHILTPLMISGSDTRILVDRGFIPYQYLDGKFKASFDRPSPVSIVGLLKETSPRKFLSPLDPPSGDGNPWVDAWLRVDIENISRQLPYPVLPVYVEVIPGGESTDLSQSIVESKDEKAEIFMPKDNTRGLVASSVDVPPSHYPVPQVDTFVPAGRHLGYVFEWAALALLTLLVAIILQLRPPKQRAAS